MQIKRVLYLFVFLFTIVTASAQELTVAKMETLSMDTYASVHKRVDNNGTACAVVRVSLPLAGATFSGTNHMGNIERVGADYMVFMPAGSKKMYIQHPNFHELEVNFSSYGIDRLQSLVTYRVTINVPQATNVQKKQTLNIKVTPADAMVLIDDEMVEGASIELTVGSHKYNVAAKGYESQSGTVDVPENRPAKLLIELDRKQTAVQNNTQVAVTTPQPAPQPVQQPVVANNTLSPQTFTVKGVSFTMIPVEGGTFTMGATEEMTEPFGDEKPPHQVTLSSYSIGETEVTQALWEAVMGSNPSNFKGAQNPVETVSWDDCQKFIKKLNQLTGKKFRLPTEAEWEYAARGGNKSRHTQYSGSSNTDEVAWYKDNSGGKTHPVKTKKANELGIYDMTGNVWEWCQDRYGDYSSSSQTNPTGATSGSYRVGRGGSWGYNARDCRSSYRYDKTPGNRNSSLGLRLAFSE